VSQHLAWGARSTCSYLFHNLARAAARPHRDALARSACRSPTIWCVEAAVEIKIAIAVLIGVALAIGIFVCVRYLINR